MATKPNLPMCKALFDYDAQDTDKLNIREGDLIEIINKGCCAIYRTLRHYIILKIVTLLLYIHNMYSI